MCHVLRITLFILLGIGLLAWPQPLFAHNELRQSIPAAGDVLPTSPPEIHLLFSETPAGAFVKLFDRQFQEIPGLDILPSGSDAHEVVALVPELENGTYTVQWLTLSADNHTVTGTFQFEVQHTSPPLFSNGVIGGVLAAAILIGTILFIHQTRKMEVSSEQSPVISYQSPVSSSQDTNNHPPHETSRRPFPIQSQTW